MRKRRRRAAEDFPGERLQNLTENGATPHLDYWSSVNARRGSPLLGVRGPGAGPLTEPLDIRVEWSGNNRCLKPCRRSELEVFAADQQMSLLGHATRSSQYDLHIFIWYSLDKLRIKLIFKTMVGETSFQSFLLCLDAKTAVL